MTDDKQKEANLRAEFSRLVRPLISTAVPSATPGMTTVEKNLLSFDLGERFLLAQTRAWLKSPDGEHLLSTLHHPTQATDSPMGNTQQADSNMPSPPQSSTHAAAPKRKKKRNKTRRPKQTKKRTAPGAKSSNEETA